MDKQREDFEKKFPIPAHWIEFDEKRNKYYCPYVADAKAQEYQARWETWQQAQKVAVPEGFVLIEESKIKTWYQDNDEPENWANNINELDVLGGSIDEDEFINVNQISETIVQTVGKFGVWKVELIDQYGDVHRNFVLVDSYEDAQKIIESNKFIHAQFEAQENST